MITLKKLAAFACCIAFLSSCVSSDVLESASSSNASATQAPQTASADPAPRPAPETANSLSDNDTSADNSNLMAAVDPSASSGNNAGLNSQETEGPLQPPAAKGPSKTFLINGLLSAVPFIGYGFRNLKKKIPDAKLYSYMGVVEGPAAIAPEVIKKASAAYQKDPTTRINLIGISLGADLITVIAEKLNEKGVPVAYLGIVDGTNLRPITANVKVADNLTCSNLDCTRAKAKLAAGNTTTVLTRKIYRSSHIPLGDHDEMHARVIAQTQ